MLMEDAKQSFGRKCQICRSDGLLVCSKCKVTNYCSVECQKKGWKEGNHRKHCRPNNPKPPSISAFIESCGRPPVDEDMETGYRYILVKPDESDRGRRRSRRDFYDSFVGITEDAGLDQLSTEHSLNVPEEVNTSLKEHYGWPSGPTRSTVPGYKADYDGCSLVAFFDDMMYSRASLAENTAGNFLLMVPFERPCRGNIVFGRITTDESTGKITHLPITRKEVIEMVEYNKFCGESGAVSDRIHFENICRSQTLDFIKSQNFVTMNL